MQTRERIAMNFAIAMILIAGMLLAAAVGYWVALRRSDADLRAQRAEQGRENDQLAHSNAQLTGELTAVQRSLAAAESQLEQQREERQQWDEVMNPVQTALKLLTERVDKSDKSRVTKETEILAKLGRMSEDFGQASQDVREETRRLNSALSRSENRGSWGEMQLRRLVEAAGMLRHVHFEEQHTTTADDQVQRPDLLVQLAGGRHAVVDAKVPLDAFLSAEDPNDAAALDRHAAAVADHLQKLGSKEYWRQYDSPEFVVMFLPAEGLLAAALGAQPELLQKGIDKRVLIATPNTLLAMLLTIDHSWRQLEAAAQAREIQQAGNELYQRVQRLVELLSSLGKSINTTSDRYNQLVGSVETRLLPAGRRMAELAISDTPIPAPDRATTEIRSLDAGKWPSLGDAVVIHPELAEPLSGDDQEPPGVTPGRQSA
jgi:DNA recombination protein RmuC